MNGSRVGSEELGGCNPVEREKEDPRVNGDTCESTITASCIRNSPGPTPSTPPPSECSPSDETTDANLDDRIRFALNELDFDESNHRTSNFSRPPAPNDSRSIENGTLHDSGSVGSGSSSDSEGEACPNEMGYMPLPQEPDMDGDEDCDGSECTSRIPPLQQIAAAGGGGVWDSSSWEDPALTSAAPPQQQNSAVKCKSIGSTSDGAGGKSEGNPASRLKDDEVESIKKAMSGFSLPTSAVPEWAKHVPEDVWKSELMGGLHGKLKEKNP